jgi:hypothetical protein
MPPFPQTVVYIVIQKRLINLVHRIQIYDLLQPSNTEYEIYGNFQNSILDIRWGTMP